MKKFSLFLIAVMFFCFGIVTPGCSKDAGGEAPEVSAGTWINAAGFKLADHKDKVVIVEFWATWCPPCRTSIPHLKTLYNEYKDRGVLVVSLTAEPADTVNEFNKKAGMNWIIGAESESGSDYSVSGIPAAFIVVDGKIVWNGHPMGGLDVELKKIVEARAGSTPAPAPQAPTAPVVAPVSVTEPEALEVAPDTDNAPAPAADESVLPKETSTDTASEVDTVFDADEASIDEEPAAADSAVSADKDGENLGE